MKTILSIFFYFALITCTRTIYIPQNENINDGEYDSEYPAQPTSQYLEEINGVVKMVNAIASYRGYNFSIKNGPSKNQITDSILVQKAISEKFINSPATGTATIIYHDNKKIALLTCAHIVSFPDTIINYYLDKHGKKTPFIESVFFKVRQNITVTELPEVNDFEILARDEQNDIAVIGKNYTKEHILNINVFNYPKGNASELRLGTFVYLFGFPRGERTLTKALVSRPNKDSDNKFVLDAAVHNGISGGPVIAIRDGVPNFEMVGMVYAVAGEQLEFLGPERDTEKGELDYQHIYEGDVYLNTKRTIIYGITYAVSIELIAKFINENQNVFTEKGYDSSQFLYKTASRPNNSNQP